MCFLTTWSALSSSFVHCWMPISATTRYEVQIILTHVVIAFLRVHFGSLSLASCLIVIITIVILPLELFFLFLLSASFGTLLLDIIKQTSKPIQVQDNTQYQNGSTNSRNESRDQIVIVAVLEDGCLEDFKTELEVVIVSVGGNHIDKSVIVHFNLNLGSLDLSDVWFDGVGGQECSIRLLV